MHGEEKRYKDFFGKSAQLIWPRYITGSKNKRNGEQRVKAELKVGNLKLGRAVMPCRELGEQEKA